MVRVLVLGISVVVLAAPAAATIGSGLYGKVTRGPVTPVCTTTQPCYAAAPGITVAFTRAGAIVARVRTGQGGAYRVALPPGTYTVRQVRPTATLEPPSMKPRVVRVRAHLWTRLNLVVDSGIR